MQSRPMDDALGRYVQASINAAEGCQDFSLAGPDGTKVGTDLALFQGHIMYLTDDPQVAVVPPQVISFQKSLIPARGLQTKFA